MAVKATQDSGVIEQKVFAVPGLKDSLSAPILRAFVNRLAPKISMGNTSHLILEAFSNIDVTAEKMSQILNTNPYFNYQFKRAFGVMVDSLGKKDFIPNNESAFILMGMQNSRNLIVALQMMRMIRGGHPSWGKDGKIQVAPKDVLKYALKTEEVLDGDKNQYADMAYAAGVVFDFMAILAGDLAEDRRKAVSYVEQVYIHGLRSAQVAMNIANQMPEFSFKKYLFAACLIHDIGKIAMAILDPHYMDFVDSCSKKGLTRQVRLFAERSRFGIDHASLGSLFCYYFKIFLPIHKAILYHHSPHLLKTADKNIYPLTSLVCLVSNVANNFKRPDGPQDPIVALWKGLELKDFKIEPDQIVLAMSKAV